jgi:hypothetical protein
MHDTWIKKVSSDLTQASNGMATWTATCDLKNLLLSHAYRWYSSQQYNNDVAFDQLIHICGMCKKRLQQKQSPAMVQDPPGTKQRLDFGLLSRYTVLHVLKWGDEEERGDREEVTAHTTAHSSSRHARRACRALKISKVILGVSLSIFSEAFAAPKKIHALYLCWYRARLRESEQLGMKIEKSMRLVPFLDIHP